MSLAPGPAKKILHSDTGEISIDGTAEIMVIDTPKTAGGFCGAGKSFATSDQRLSVKLSESEGTVWLSSLDDKPLTDSARILVTHLTDLQNTGIHYAEKARKTLLDWGKLPHLVREGKAVITLKHSNPDKLKIWALSTGGKRLFELKTTAANGAISFTADVSENAAASGAHFCYEITE